MESDEAISSIAFDGSLDLPDQIATSSQNDRPGVIREDDLNTAFIDDEYKDFILGQINRLKKVLSEPIPDALKLPGCPLDKAKEQSRRRTAAQRQLARLTVVFRRLMWKHSQGELDPGELESWMADIIDASLYDDQCQGKPLCSAAAIMDSILHEGEQQEMEVLVQELVAENVDDVIELHNVDQSTEDETVVPEKGHVFNQLGEGAMFKHSYADSKSDDESIYRVRKKRLAARTPEEAYMSPLPKHDAETEKSQDKLVSSPCLPNLQSLFAELGEKETKLPKKKRTIDLRWPRTPR